MNTSNKPMTGAVIVAVAVIWQGIGTAVVGMRVAPELSNFTTFSAFLIAAVLSTIGYFAVKQRKSSVNSENAVDAPRATKPQRVKSALALNLFSAGAFCIRRAGRQARASACSPLPRSGSTWRGF